MPSFFVFSLLDASDMIVGWTYLEGPALGRSGNSHQGTHVLARVLEAVLARDGRHLRGRALCIIDRGQPWDIGEGLGGRRDATVAVI